jgi:sterol desaturase/sphingolipid hydroxylase (fatty acid hydroxylase superfamily)
VQQFLRSISICFENGQLMNPIAFAVPVFLLLILLELWVAHSRGVSVYRLKDSLTSINVGIMSEFSKAIGGLISVIMYTLISDRFGAYTWDVSNPMTWISAFLLYDFCYYWVHRTGHEVNILWASHVVHHSSEEFNLSTALRQSSTGFLFRWIFYIPLALLGYPVKVFVVVGLIDFIYQYWVHTQLIGKLGWLEYVVVTPSNHRVHHGQNDYCIESWNPLWANLHQFVQIGRQVKSAENWRHRLMYIFAKPSWTPEKEDATEVFEKNRFNRFDTPATAGLIGFAFGGTLMGVALLMVYFYLQSRMPQPLRIAYCVVMVLAIAAIGWRMTQARQKSELRSSEGHSHA